MLLHHVFLILLPMQMLFLLTFYITCSAASADQQKRSGHSYEGKIYERHETKSSKVGFSNSFFLENFVISGVFGMHY